MSIDARLAATKPSFLALLLLAGSGGCRGSDSASLLEQQTAISRLDATRAELRHLEQEDLKERAHVAELERRVVALRDREAVLDQETADLSIRVAAAEDRLRALKDRAAAIDAEEKALLEKAAAAEKEKNRIPELETKLSELEAQTATIRKELEAAKAGAVTPQEPAPSGKGDG